MDKLIPVFDIFIMSDNVFEERKKKMFKEIFLLKDVIPSFRGVPFYGTPPSGRPWIGLEHINKVSANYFYIFNHRCNKFLILLFIFSGKNKL